MKRKLALLLAGVMTLGLVGCGSSTSTTTTETTTEAATEAATEEAATEVAASGETFELKLGHIQTAEHPLGQSAEYFAELVSEYTGGAVTISIFPASQLGSESEIFDAVDIGSIDFALLGFGEPADKFTDIGIFDAPYLADDRDHMVRILNSDETFALFEEMTEYMNVKGLGGFYYGARYLTTANDEVRSPEDMTGLNIRVPDQTMYIETLSAMGCVATPMSFSEVYLSLQQGVIDGEENPLSSIASNKFDEVQTYLIKTEHIIGTQALYVSTGTLDSLPAEYVTAIEAA
ncbi:MAG: DctP family TRAP transporter solute-binding subunit, partial [Eubacteriales bacterium]